MWRHEDDLQRMLRESVDRFAAAQDTLAQFRRNRETAEGFDPDRWRAAAELGWTAVLLPEAWGGMGLAMVPALSLIEGTGRHLMTEPFIASAVIAASILGESATEEARRLSAALASGEAVVVLADQEEDGFLGPAKPGTSLESLGSGEYRLTGRKRLVPAWTRQTVLLVSAVIADRICLAAIDADAPGVNAVPHRMTDGTVCADVTFEQVSLGSRAILLDGSAASAALALATARGTIAVAAQLEGAARSLLERTCDYLRQRIQFGSPLANFQSIRHRLASVHLQVELAGASWRSAARAMDEDFSPGTLAKISMAKARCSDVALDVAQAAIHYHGAFGFTEEADVGLFLNAVLRWSSWQGSASAHRLNALRLSKDELREHA